MEYLTFGNLINLNLIMYLTFGIIHLELVTGQQISGIYCDWAMQAYVPRLLCLCDLKIN